jgi:signal transduction histidine kinase
MDLFHTTLRASACADAEGAFAAVVAGLTDAPLHFGCWCDADAHPLATHPPDLVLADELRELAAHARHVDGYTLRALSPALEERHPGAGLLLVPVPGEAGEPSGGLILAAPAGAFGDDVEGWRLLGETLGTVLRRAGELRGAREECERLRLRVEEVEAMDVLGLAANRTLDPDEVLGLVARFSRTLLEADYVTVSSADGGRVRAQAAVGLRAGELAEGDDPLARGVVELGKPLYLGEGEALEVAGFHAHAEEGMRSGFGVPLSLFGETLGALVVGYRAPYRVTRQDTRLAVSMARHAAVAIANAELHRAVESHSAEMQRANEQLRALAGVKERFFNTMSHELRTPLTAMKGYTELLMDGVAGELPPQAGRYVARCHASALNLLQLVDDLLDLAKIEADRMEVHPHPCSLDEIVEQALASVEPQAEAKGLRLAADTAGAPPLRTDAKRVRQILTNLLSNAVKFTAAGEVRLSAQVVRERTFDDCDDPEATPWLDVRVADTGQGIAAENLDLVFREYGQVPGSEGTGLGLPISRKLARLLGGDLRVESTPGAGSTFTLRLPMAGPVSETVRVAGAQVAVTRVAAAAGV